MKRILVDPGESANIVFLFSLLGMELTTKDMIKTESVLVEFDGSLAQAIINIPFTIFTPLYNLLHDFVIIDAPSIYNIIMRRPWIHRLAAVPFNHHQILKQEVNWVNDEGPVSNHKGWDDGQRTTSS